MEKVILILISILNCFFGAIAAFLLKKGSKDINKIKKNLFYFFKSKLFYGLFIYGVTAVASILILRWLDVLIFYPLTSMTYVFSFFLAKKYLKEKITLQKILGMMLIIIGVVLLSI